MSRNVFKLSGNMALGSENPYPPTDIADIKQSLRLLKAKQSQKKSEQYGGQYEYNQNTYSNPQNTKTYEQYQQAARNNLPENRPQQFEDVGRKQTRTGDYEQRKYYPQQDNYEQQQKYNYAQEYAGRKEQQKQESVKRREPERRPIEKPQRQQRQQRLQRQQMQQRLQRQQKQQRQQRLQRQAERKQPQRRKRQDIQPQRRMKQLPQGNAKVRDQNAFDQKSIKEVNKQNRIAIVQYDPSQLVECSEGCGRKFNPDSLSKHEDICKKVFQNQRKVFNAQQKRLVEAGQKKLMKIGEAVEKKMEAKKAKEKIPKWKAESLAFRQGLKASQGKQLSQEDTRMLQQNNKDTSVKCQYCGRTFNLTAGPRHIAFCEQQSKKKSMKR